jgi:MFS family permease
LFEIGRAGPGANSIEASLGAARREGAVAQVAVCALDYYLIPYALALGGSLPHVVALTAAPALAATLAQLLMNRVLRGAGDRKRLLMGGALLQALILVPLPALAFLSLEPRAKLGLLIGCVVVFRAAGGMIGPAWGSLMGDYLPESRRGEYFGLRSQLVGICAMASLVAFGGLLASLSGRGEAGFALVFVAAAGARAWSCLYMGRLTPMPEHAAVAVGLRWAHFAASLRENAFARFVAYVAGVTFAAQLTTAFYSVHMLRDLGYGFFPYTMIHLAALVSGFVSYPIWGRHADLAGNARVLRLNGFLLPAIPVLWALSEHPVFLFGVELFAGFAWAGFTLCSANFVYDCAAPKDRLRALSFFNVITAAALLSGAVAGGWLAERIPALGGHRLHSLFIVSALIRLSVVCLLGGSFKDTRMGTLAVGKTSLFFSIVGLRPLIGPNIGLRWTAASPPPLGR